MLTQVPNTVNRLARNVVLNHPNSFNAHVYRKHYLRADPKDDTGRPTLGGVGILSSEDEDEYEYEYMGNAYVLFCNGFDPAPLTDIHDANIGASNEFRALLECEAQAGEGGYFDFRNHDLVYLVFGGDENGQHMCKLGYELTGSETTMNIPPFSTRWIMNRRSDLDVSPDDPQGGYF